jgi:hypothetical protein
LPDPYGRREMEYQVGAAQSGRERVLIPNVAGDEFGVTRQPGRQIPLGSVDLRIEVVEDDYPIAACDERIDEMTADEPGSAGDENASLAHPHLPRSR